MDAGQRYEYNDNTTYSDPLSAAQAGAASSDYEYQDQVTVGTLIALCRKLSSERLSFIIFFPLAVKLPVALRAKALSGLGGESRTSQTFDGEHSIIISDYANRPDTLLTVPSARARAGSSVSRLHFRNMLSF